MFKLRTKRAKLTIIICLVILSALSLIYVKSLDRINYWLAQQSSPIKYNYGFFDLGVTDANNDGNLDIFTTNHYTRQSLLLNDGQGQFTDVLWQWKLSQDRNFPESEDSNYEPSVKEPGLYIYWYLGNLNIQSYKINNLGEKLTGKINVFTPIQLKEKKSGNVSIKEKLVSTGATQTEIYFTVEDGSHFVLEPFQNALPFSFELDENLPLNQIYIGDKKLNPNSHNFALSLRDRHGMSWADYNGDNFIDLFISRGANQGLMNKIPLTFSDELLTNQGNNTFKDDATLFGIIKNSCPGRQVAWVDFDNDGLLDVYIVCGRKQLKTETFPNQLYRQEADGHFTNVAAKVGLDFPREGTFAWLDFDRDLDLDLVWAEEQQLRLYVNKAGKFEPQSLSSINGEILKFAISDYDLDGDLDILAISRQSNILLINNEGKYSLTNPTLLGLPKRSLTANWVDYDNDGLPDLHFIPQGVYRQGRDHYFQAKKLLTFFSKSPIVEARCTWFDGNNDGLREVIAVLKNSPSSQPPLLLKIFTRLLPNNTVQKWQKQWDAQKSKKGWLMNWHSAMYRNIGSKNHWLQVKLIGSDGNNQAIGAQVVVVTPDGSQLQQVGSSEGSHYSQGHYRLYFGLGPHEKADFIKVIWPDGYQQEFQNPESDQLLIIKREVEKAA